MLPKKILWLTVFSFAAVVGIAQADVFFNNGAIIGIDNDVDVYVGFDLQNETPTAFISNAGRLTVMGDIVNNSEITGGSFSGQPVAPDTGVFNLYGNWVNSGNFKADKSTVNLKGGNQSISGSSITSFYNLNAVESPNAIKQLVDVDANVSGVFSLKNGVEFATQNNRLEILSSSASAIAFDNNSFVSSEGIGRLMRATASESAYFFPVGWNNGTASFIRPVIIKPESDAAASFDVRFVLDNPTNDGFDISKKQDFVEKVNDKFYHLIKQRTGSTLPADLLLLFNPQTDGDWNSIARWQNLPQWEDLFAEQNTVVSSYNAVSKSKWLSTIDEPHVLTKKMEQASEYEFPSAFSPNSDQVNDRFGLVPGSVAKLEGMRIYNRWGELIFDKEREGNESWDGTYEGKPQPMGTYMMHAKVKLLNGEIKNETRTISLIY